MSKIVYNGLNTIKNAKAVSLEKVVLASSNHLLELLKVLKKNEYILDYKLMQDKVKNTIEVKINRDNKQNLRFISTPGHRIYLQATKLPVVKSGRGYLIVNTNKGIMTGYQAFVNKIGGEIICEVA
jgi:small subunit ribosomal protein S8